VRRRGRIFGRRHLDQRRPGLSGLHVAHVRGMAASAAYEAKGWAGSSVFTWSGVSFFSKHHDGDVV
jgi:hypothetical protein